MRGKRKGRGGGHKGSQVSDLPSDSPKRKDLKQEFQSPCLSHASPPITNFFQPQSKNDCVLITNENLRKKEESVESKFHSDYHSSKQLLLEEEPLSINETGTHIKELPDGGIENGADDTLCSQSPVTPHKMILIQESRPLLLSPSSALSQLSIVNSAIKKATKSRRKLNPNQTANQLAPTPPEKLKLGTKTKVRSANDGKTSSVVASNNQSQQKLTDYFPVRRSVRKTKKTVLEEKQRTLEEAVLMGKEEGLEVHTFEGKGRGIVAVRQFDKGEFVVEYAGELIKVEEAKEREKFYGQDQNTGCYMYYFKYRNQQFCVDATPESNRLGRLVNHSRNGNLLTKTITVGNVPHLVLIAKEDIHPGDEVTYDYGDRSKESLKYHPWLAS